MKSVNIKGKEYYFYVSVKFDNGNKNYYYISLDKTIKIGDKVIVETEQGLEEVSVEDTKFYDINNVPYPVEKTKLLVAKIETKDSNGLNGNSAVASQYKFEDYRNENLENRILPFCEIEEGVLKAIKRNGSSTIYIPNSVDEIENLVKIKRKPSYNEFGYAEEYYDDGVEENYDCLAELVKLYLPPSIRKATIFDTVKELGLSNGIEELYIIDPHRAFGYKGANDRKLKKISIPRSLQLLECPWHQMEEVLIDPMNPYFIMREGVLYKKLKEKEKSEFYIKNLMQSSKRTYKNEANYEYEVIWKNPNLKKMNIYYNAKLTRVDLLKGIESLVIEEGVKIISLPLANNHSKVEIEKMVIPESLMHIETKIDALYPARNHLKLKGKVYFSQHNYYVNKIELDKKNNSFCKDDDNNLYMVNPNINEYLLIVKNPSSNIEEVLSKEKIIDIQYLRYVHEGLWEKGYSDRYSTSLTYILTEWGREFFTRPYIYEFSSEDYIVTDNTTKLFKTRKEVLKKCTEIILKNDLEEIKNNFFGYDSDFPYPKYKKITFENNSLIKKIESKAFLNAEEVTQFFIPNSVVIIEDHAFEHLSKLKSIYIPSTVKIIGDSAFYASWNATIFAEAESKPLEWHDNWNPSNCPVIWGVKKYIFFNGGYYVRLKDDSIAIIGLEDCVKKYEILDDIEGFQVKIIGDRAFEGNENLEGIVISKNIVKIGNYAFSACKSLKNLSIPKSIASIGEGAFRMTDSLVSIEFENYSELKSIGDEAFRWAKSLVKVSIPDSVDNIGMFAFSDASSLKSINLTSNNEFYTTINGVLFNKQKDKLIKYPEGKTDNDYIIPPSVEYIERGAFNGVKLLKSLYIPTLIKKIEEYSFVGLSSLRVVEFAPDCQVSLIGESAFRYAYELVNINIPKKVTYIGSWAFEDARKLTKIIIPANVTIIDFAAFLGSKLLTIYVEAESKPKDWDTNWNYNNIPVIWGYKE